MLRLLICSICFSVAIIAASIAGWALTNNALLACALFHLGSALCGSIGFYTATSQQRGSVLWIALIAVCIPIAGGVFMSLLSLNGLVGKDNGIAEDYALMLADQLKQDPEATLTPNTVSDVVALRDIVMSDTDADTKRGAILALEHIENPQAVDILRLCLSDTSPEVRIYANSAIAHLEERLTDRLNALERTLGNTGGSGTAHLAIAQTCYDHIWFGLAQDVRKTHYLERCLEHAYLAIDLRAGPESWLIGGRALLGLKRYDEAELMFNAYLDAVPGDHRAVVWRAEARFHTGNFSGVSEDAENVTQGSSNKLSKTVRPAVEMWRPDPSTSRIDRSAMRKKTTPVEESHNG